MTDKTGVCAQRKAGGTYEEEPLPDERNEPCGESRKDGPQNIHCGNRKRRSTKPAHHCASDHKPSGKRRGPFSCCRRHSNSLAAGHARWLTFRTWFKIQGIFWFSVLQSSRQSIECPGRAVVWSCAAVRRARRDVGLRTCAGHSRSIEEKTGQSVAICNYPLLDLNYVPYTNVVRVN